MDKGTIKKMKEEPILNELEGLIKKAANKAVKDCKDNFVCLVSGGLDSGLLAAIIKPKCSMTVHLPFGDKYDEFDYAQKVIKHIKIKWPLTTEIDESQFKEVMKKAVKAIGRPIPHFNIFPLYVMFQELNEMGIKNVITGDGPDESMCGYARHLIMNYIYNVRNMEAFANYQGMIDTILTPDVPIIRYIDEIVKVDFDEAVALTFEEDYFINDMCKIDMGLMRRDMNDMANGIAKHFGIKIHRPYESKEVDKFMFNLPPELKIDKTGEYGKYALRLIAQKYLPKEIVWRKNKMGGPLVPVNRIMGWENTEGEFGKKKYIKFQEKILK